MRNQNPFASLIGASPFKPLQEHMRVISDCVSEVPKLFESLAANDTNSINACKAVIFKKEQEAGAIKTELRAHLPKSLFMPVDRRDLIDLLEAQHSIAEMVHKIASLLAEREMPVPDVMKPEIKEFIASCMKTFQHAVLIIEEMDELVEVGFGGREASKVDDLAAELQVLETHTQALKSQLNKTLFALEDSLSPVSLMLWYQLLQWVVEIPVRAEKTGDRVRLMLAR